MEIVQRKLSEIVPYAQNAKKHDAAQIKNVAQSIKQYGFVQPLVIDRDGVIVIGHCRALAAQQLGLDSVPCVCVDNLSPQQVDALRIVDNKCNESEWDAELLAEQLPLLDLEAFDFSFDLPEIAEALDIEVPVPAQLEEDEVQVHCPKCGFFFGVRP